MNTLPDIVRNYEVRMGPGAVNTCYESGVELYRRQDHVSSLIVAIVDYMADCRKSPDARRLIKKLLESRKFPDDVKEKMSKIVGPLLEEIVELNYNSDNIFNLMVAFVEFTRESLPTHNEHALRDAVMKQCHKLLFVCSNGCFNAVSKPLIIKQLERMYKVFFLLDSYLILAAKNDCGERPVVPVGTEEMMTRIIEERVTARLAAERSGTVPAPAAGGVPGGLFNW